MMQTTATYRLILFNTCAFAGVAWAAKLGYVRQVFEGDISHISYAIVALFAVGMIATVRGAESILTDISEWLVTLGLIGNVVGFVLALRGVGSLDDTQAVAVQLLSGMGVAFYSTLVGAVCALWTQVNRRIVISTMEN